MRLTLRTLLAYLDDLLDRRDAEELEAKIQSSPLASELVHRIRNTVGQIRLDSPPVAGEGMGGDPNTVAEYLDNTLPPEGVPDFERVCLDSDVHLGEVAACHQVLTLVLGEPAEVSPEMRRRVYGLGNEDDSDASVLDEPVDASLGSTRLPVTNSDLGDSGDNIEEPQAPSPSADERWKYPDQKASYTADKSVRVLPLALTALAAFVLVFAGLRGLGPFDSSHPIAKLFNGSQVASNDADEADGVPVVDLGEGIEPQSTDDLGAAGSGDEAFLDPELASDTDLPNPSGDDAPAFTDGDAAFSDGPGFDSGESVEEDVIDTADSAIDSDPGFDAGIAGDEANTINPDANQLTLTNPGNPVVPPEPRPLRNPVENRINNASNGDVSLVPTFPGETGLDRTNDQLTSESDQFVDGAGPTFDDPNLDVATAEQPFDPVMEGGPVEPAGPVELGQLVTEQSVVLRLNADTQSWGRPKNGSPLLAGDEYLSLPIYRSRFSFGSGVDVTLIGATSVKLMPEARRGVPRVLVNHGRILVAPTDEQGLEIDLSIGGHEGQILFDDAESVLALDVRHEHLPGNDPTAGPPMVVVEAYSTTGIVHWSEVDRDAIQISAGQRLAFVGERIGKTNDVANMPIWINPRRVKPINARAARDLAPMVSFDRPVVLSLQEQTDHRRPEIRSLTACSLAYLGDLRPLVTALNDERLKAYRKEQFETLKKLVASSPEAATAVREAFSVRHGERTDEFFRILWGYSPTELQAGASTELVEHLLDESLDFRIVAIETLKQITGKSVTTFGPEQSKNSRRKAYLHWSSDAKKNRIAYKSIPAILELTN